MSNNIASFIRFIRRLRRDESGSVMVLVAISMIALLGVTALAFDVGNLVYAQRRLQATTDMAAQAGALDLNCSGCTAATPITTATTYSAVSGDLNAQTGLNVTMASGYPKLYCLASTGIFGSACSNATSGNNAIEVQQQATVPVFFAGLLGTASVTLTATALASAKSGALPPQHVMLVIDNTGSMNNTDPTSPAPTDCGITNPKRIDCALAGVQLLMNELWPTQDEVGLMVFPPLTTGTAADDALCATTAPTLTTYGSGTYVVPVGGTASNPMVTNYKTSNTATTLNVVSGNIAAATCQSGMTTAAATCGTCAGLKAIGGEGTYLAGAISAAQSALNTNSVSGVQNVIIVLSDGGAGNAGSHGAPASNECINAVTAAQNAANAGTWVYSIAYGSSTALSPNANSCSDTESPRISSCTTMADIASDPTKFYSDPMGAGGSNNVDVNTIQIDQNLHLSSQINAGGTVLTFASVPSTVQVGMGVQDTTPGHSTYIPTGTTVTAKTATTVTISSGVTNAIAKSATDQIQFAYSFPSPSASSTVLYFTSVPATVKAGMGVADATNPSVILSATTVASTTATTVTINAGEGGFAGIGVQPNDQIVFSPVGNCTSQDNPTPTDLVSIFAAIGTSLSYTQLLPLTCLPGGATSGANAC